MRSLPRGGARVHAVDYSDVAIAQLRSLAEEAGLPITTESGDVLDLAPAPMTYDAIFMVSFLSHLEAADLTRVVDMAHESLVPDGKVYVEAFTTADPGYRKAADARETSPELRHYFAPGALRRLFSRFAISDYREFVEDDRTHGPAHRHGVALLVAGRGR
jgi:cyclopropane fatty-acyl-phospholipid synthase-like methyltransferase